MKDMETINQIATKYEGIYLKSYENAWGLEPCIEAYINDPAV